MSKRYIYLRDFNLQNNHPVGCVLMETNKKDGKIYYAVSVCSPKDRWNRDMAKDLADSNFKNQANRYVVETVVPEDTHAITRLVMQDIVNRNKDQSKERSRSFLAFESASKWLEMADKAADKKVQSEHGQEN